MPSAKKLDPDEAKAVIEEVKAAEEQEIAAKSKRITGEVTALPKVNRGKDGGVTSATVPMKVRFVKGDVSVLLKGDLASAYWSVTPGMRLNVTGIPNGENAYVAVGLTVLPNTTDR